MTLSKPVILITCLCLLLAGVTTFNLAAFRASTVVLDAKTVQNGTGTIVAEGGASHATTRIHFAVQTELEGYVVELPAQPLNSVRILPLAGPGNFIVNTITLSNDLISYRWNNSDDCSKKYVRENQTVHAKCDPDQPVLTLGDDGSFLISAIPETGICRTAHERVVVAVGVTSGLLLICIGLFLIIQKTSCLTRLQLLCSLAVWLMLLSVYLYQLYNIYSYSVDVPYSDDWIFFEPRKLTAGFPYHWLFSQELEHRIVLTKLQSWINLKLFSLDYRIQKIFNYLLFGGVVLSFAFLKSKLIGKDRFIAYPLFLVFLLSPIAWENHRWALQSDYHFALLFSCLALCYISPREISPTSIGLFCTFLGLAMYSLAPGAVLASVYLGCSVVYLVAKMRDKTVFTSLHKLLLVQILAMGVVFSVWFYGYKSPTEIWPHKYLFPWEPGYVSSFLNMVSFSFGFQEEHVIPGIVCLCIVLLPLCVLLGKSKTRWQSSTWCLVPATVGILTVFAVISMSRADVNFYGAKTSRYAEIGFLMIPLMAMAWWHAVPSRVPRNTLLVLLWLFCFYGYYDNWSSQPYRETKHYDLQTLECAEKYYRGTGDGTCRGETFPNPLVLDRAKELGVNFTKQFIQSPVK